MLTMGICFIAGVVAIYGLRDQFSNIKTINDAIYFSFMTYSTVGYGTANPLTPLAQYVSVIMALVGVGSFCTLITLILGPFIEKKIKKVIIMFDQLEHMQQHAVVCGVNAMSLQIAQDLRKNNIIVIFVSNDPTSINKVKDLNYYTYLGEATEENTLNKVFIKRADYLVGAMDTDAKNILLAMTAKRITQVDDKTNKLTISMLIQNQDNVADAKLAGADVVVTPATLVAQDLFNKLDCCDGMSITTA